MLSEFIFFVLSVYEGWFLHRKQEPTGIEFTEGRGLPLRPERMATSVTGRFCLARSCARGGLSRGIAEGRKDLSPTSLEDFAMLRGMARHEKESNSLPGLIRRACARATMLRSAM